MKIMSKNIADIELFTKSIQEGTAALPTGYLVLMQTDKFDLQRLSDMQIDIEQMFCKGLEIRMFDKTREMKWFRGSIDREWKYRSIEDAAETLYGEGGESASKYWDEYQYLDIDETRSDPEKGIAYATGGGKYRLPLKNYKDARIRVRNYLEYDEDSGQLHISDWRLVELMEGGN